MSGTQKMAWYDPFRNWLSSALKREARKQADQQKEAYFWAMRKFRDRSRYMPHQGKRECERRRMGGFAGSGGK